MIDFVELPKGDIKLRLYNSFKPFRLKAEDTGSLEETKEEYRIRQKTIKRFYKQRKNVKHVSTMLIPSLDNNGDMIYNDKGNPVFLGKTKGKTYIKNDSSTHFKRADHLKQIKNGKE